MTEAERTRKRQVAQRLQRVKADRILRETESLVEELDRVVRARSVPPAPESAGTVVESTKKP